MVISRPLLAACLIAAFPTTALICTSASAAQANLGVPPGDIIDVTLARLFPSVPPVAPPPAIWCVLFFGDTNSQYEIAIYPGGHGTLTRRAIMGVDGPQLYELAVRDQGRHSAADLASRLKLSTSIAQIAYSDVGPTLSTLAKVRVSPQTLLRITPSDYTGLVHVDMVLKYEFCFDTGQDYAHFAITDTGAEAPDGGLVRWMLAARPRFDGLLQR